MNFRFSEREEAFRAEVKAFLAVEVTPDLEPGGRSELVSTPARRAFMRRLAQRGWLGMSFPAEYGGTESPMPLAQYILNQELWLARAPTIGQNIGVVASALLKFGSEALKREFLPPTLAGECFWSLGYSEPEAGSDLANLQCRAVLVGDEYVIDGTKRFITGAHYNDCYWMAVRTDADAPRHKGISLIVVPADTAGISMSPMWMMTGEQVNEVYFDGVRVPARYLVGEENRGWYYLMEALDFERFTITAFAPNVLRFEEFVAWLRTAERDGRPLRDDPVVRRRVAEMRVRLEIGRMLELRCIAANARPGYVPNLEATFNKIWASLFEPDLDDLAVDLSGPAGYLWSGEDAVDGGRWTRSWTAGPHLRTAAAGVDVSKNILARRGLGLPN